MSTDRLNNTPVSAEPVGLLLEVCTLGNYGAAYDLPGKRRAYTYEHQPGNVKASRLGSACLEAAAASAGDTIDRGLGLLKELQAQGFGVFDVEASRWHAAPVAAQPDVTQQTLDDVMAGIPARDAEIEALRKEIETLRAQQPVSGADGLADYPTHGMSLGQRIAYVGGRENAQGYVEFGSPMAVHALIQHVLRDFHRQGRVSLAPAKQDADKVDAERWRAYRSSVAADDAGFLQRALNAIEAMGLEDGQLPSEDQIDAAIDAARKEPGQ